MKGQRRGKTRRHAHIQRPQIQQTKNLNCIDFHQKLSQLLIWMYSSKTMQLNCSLNRTNLKQKQRVQFRSPPWSTAYYCRTCATRRVLGLNQVNICIGKWIWCQKESESHLCTLCDSEHVLTFPSYVCESSKKEYTFKFT